MANELQDKLDAILEDKNTNLKPENLRAGVTCLGIEGVMEAGVDTSDADATGEDIANGKTAYVNGEKITGNITEIKEGHIPAFDWTWQNWTNSDFIRVYGTLNRDYLLRKNTSTDATIQYDELASMLEVTPDKIKKGETILKIDGTYEGSRTTDIPVKLFETEEEMQADETAEEGDLAIIYRNEIRNMNADSKAQVISFPATVVLPSAISGSSSCTFRSESYNTDMSASLSATRFRVIAYTSETSYSVSYSSTDGITYTKSSGPDSIDLGEPIVCYRPESWVDAFGYFMLCGGMVFDGLYNYTLNNKSSKIQLRDLTSAIITVGSDGATSFSVPDLIPDIAYDLDELTTLLNKYNLYGGMFYLDTDDNLKYSTVRTQRYILDNTGTIIGIGDYGQGDTTIVYDADLLELTLSNPVTYEVSTFVTNSSSPSTYSYYNITNLKSMPFYPGMSTSYYGAVIVKDTAMNKWCKQVDQYIYVDKYTPAPTQLTLANENELLTGKIAYGKNGIITGDGSIYDNLNLTSKLGINYTALPDSVTTTGFVEINNECDIDSFEDNLGVSVSELPLSLSNCEILGKFRYIFDSSNGNIKLYDDKQFLGENTFSELVGIDAYRQRNEYFDCSDNVIVIQANESGASATALIKCTVDYSTSEPTCIWELLHSGSAISDNYDVYNGNVYWGRQNGSNYELYENGNLLYKFTGVTFSYATSATHVVLDGKLYITDHKNCICFDIDTHTYTTFTLDYDSSTVVNIKLVTSDRKYVILNDTIYKAENNGLTKISDTSSYLSVGTVVFNGYKTASVIELNGKHYFFTGKGLYCEEDGTFTQVTGLSNYRIQQIIGNTKQELVYNLKSSDTGIRLLQVSPDNLSEYIISNLSHEKYILVTSYEHLNT